MTIQDFQQACDGVATSGTATSVPCPIVVGDGPIQASIGDTFDHELVIFNIDPNLVLSAYSSVTFSFDAPNNETVIQPKTHETS